MLQIWDLDLCTSLCFNAVGIKDLPPLKTGFYWFYVSVKTGF